MAITIRTPADKAKQYLNAAGTNATALSVEQWTDLMIGHARTTSSTYTFQKVAVGYYTLIGYTGVSLLAVGTPYTETSGVSSTFSPGWQETAANIVVTDGAQSGDTISVTATPIDWCGMILAAISELKAHAARAPDSIGILGASAGFGSLMERLDTLEQQVRGANYV